jgi:hypothetical protein
VPLLVERNIPLSKSPANKFVPETQRHVTSLGPGDVGTHCAEAKGQIRTMASARQMEFVLTISSFQRKRRKDVCGSGRNRLGVELYGGWKTRRHTESHIESRFISKLRASSWRHNLPPAVDKSILHSRDRYRRIALRGSRHFALPEQES